MLFLINELNKYSLIQINHFQVKRIFKFLCGINHEYDPIQVQKSILYIV